jgi:preprotein translocase subunit SecA
VRKTLLKFDNVLNDQRKVIFGQRNNIISSKNAFEYSDEFLDAILIKLMELKKINLSKDKNSEHSVQIRSILGKSFDQNEIGLILDSNDEKFEKEIRDKFSKKRSDRELVLGKDQTLEIEKRILLQLIDQNWKSHIQYLEQLRGVIGLRSYGNRDPLIEYKKEAFSLFENLLFKLKSDLITVLLNLEVVKKTEETQKINKEDKVPFKKVGRNQLCPCNSGKKYKHCHGSL